MLHVRRQKMAAPLKNLWLSVHETTESVKTLRFQDTTSFILGVKLRLALDSKYFKHSLTC